jgi:NMD protein affecting ribosome stability and mRNA decay
MTAHCKQCGAPTRPGRWCCSACSRIASRSRADRIAYEREHRLRAVEAMIEQQRLDLLWARLHKDREAVGG